MWVLLARRAPNEPVKKTMVWISVVMFVLATMVRIPHHPHLPPIDRCAYRALQHIGVNYTRVIRAFIKFRNEPGGPAAYFNELSEFTQIFGSTIYIAQTIVGDSVVVRIPVRFPCVFAVH